MQDRSEETKKELMDAHNEILYDDVVGVILGFIYKKCRVCKKLDKWDFCLKCHREWTENWRNHGTNH